MVVVVYVCVRAHVTDVTLVRCRGLSVKSIKVSVGRVVVVVKNVENFAGVSVREFCVNVKVVFE